ncbi:MAG: hypothetical protein HY778_01035 [Betaproteobacteria bacterium]|nr:hypothetical protein [Betaproteobacteria bacterium]
MFVHDGRFYVADYKSNWLGAEASDYGPQALAEAMTASGYHLQYLLYTVALHRWLRLRRADYRYERDFGGVLYLFLRGMGVGGTGQGVYAVHPSVALVERLDRLLAGEGEPP